MKLANRSFFRLGGLALLVLLMTFFATACVPQTVAPAEEAAPTEAVAEEAEPTEEAAEEDATAEPAEEAAEEEATAEPEEEAAAEEMAAMGDPAAGEYIFNIATGCGCHFNRDLGALAGGVGFIDDTVFSKNLTPHETGIANRSDEALADSIRFAAYDDQALVVMPAFSTMADDDVMNLIAYLRSLEPVENEIPERTIAFEPEAGEYPAPPAMAPTEGAERGQYLAAIARCSRCHTPRNEDGSMNMDLFLAGAPFQDTVAPNLTPDSATGLGDWSEEGIAAFLQTGIYSDGLEAHAGMKSQVDRGLNQLTDKDALAIAAWLKSLPPIDNLPQLAE